jgi:hypothetical protein
LPGEGKVTVFDGLQRLPDRVGMIDVVLDLQKVLGAQKCRSEHDKKQNPTFAAAHNLIIGNRDRS